MNTKIKDLILKSIILLMSVMLVLGLLFTLQELNDSYQVYRENGFDLLSFNSIFISSSYNWGNIIMGILSIIQLLTGIAFTILSIIPFLKNIERIRNIQILTIIIVCAFSMLYMVEGIVFTIITTVTYDSHLFSSSSWVLLLVEMLLLIGYIVVSSIKTGDEISIKQKTTKSKYIIYYDDLIKLKGLLDNNVITQEEYDLEKNKLLN